MCSSTLMKPCLSRSSPSIPFSHPAAAACVHHTTSSHSMMSPPSMARPYPRHEEEGKEEGGRREGGRREEGEWRMAEEGRREGGRRKEEGRVSSCFNAARRPAKSCKTITYITHNTQHANTQHGNTPQHTTTLFPLSPRPL